MAITNGYATLAEYKAFISMRGLAGAVGTDASDDAVIELLVEFASRYIDAQTARRFWVDGSDTVYYYQAENTELVNLPDFASITTVAVDFNNTRSYTELTVNTDYDLLPDNYTAEGKPINGLALSPLSSYYFPTQRRAIKVTGKRGWASVPKDITDATLEIVNNVYASRSGQASAGRVSVTASGIVIRPEDVPEIAQAVILHYRNIT